MSTLIHAMLNHHNTTDNSTIYTTSTPTCLINTSSDLWTTAHSIKHYINTYKHTWKLTMKFTSICFRSHILFLFPNSTYTSNHKFYVSDFTTQLLAQTWNTYCNMSRTRNYIFKIVSQRAFWIFVLQRINVRRLRKYCQPVNYTVCLLESWRNL